MASATGGLTSADPIEAIERTQRRRGGNLVERKADRGRDVGAPVQFMAVLVSLD
jgi:hypothetical protein